MLSADYLVSYDHSHINKEIDYLEYAIKNVKPSNKLIVLTKGG